MSDLAVHGNYEPSTVSSREVDGSRQAVRLHQLLVTTGQALCAGDAVAVSRQAAELEGFLGEGADAPARGQLDLQGLAQHSPHLWLALMESSAFYRGALQRWRRTLNLRRNILLAEDEAYTYSSRLFGREK
jgi:hypothetical protein